MGKSVVNKEDGGALLFWSYHNQLQAKLEQIDKTLLELMRAGHEYKRRLSSIEEAIKSHRKLIFHDQQAVRMFCIACHHEFDVPVYEASDPEFVTVCPRCHNWSLPIREGNDQIPTVSAKQISEEVGRPYDTVVRTARELGLGHKYGTRYKTFTQAESQQIKSVVAKKRRVQKGGDHGRKIENPG